METVVALIEEALEALRAGRYDRCAWLLWVVRSELADLMTVEITFDHDDRPEQRAFDGQRDGQRYGQRHDAAPTARR
mgnify:CR=1 FL=1